jgi:hypothetical protein
MLIQRFSVLWGLLLLSGFSACSRFTPSVSCIPKDAFFASRANILRATYQVPNWKEVLKEEFELDLNADTVSKPAFLASGKAYIFGDIFKAEENYIALSIAMMNKRNLEKILKKMNPSLNFEEHKSPHRKYKFIVRNKSLLAWSGSHLMFINARQAGNESKLREIFKRLADLKREESLMSANENFSKALSNDYDLALWLNIAKVGDIPLLKKFAKNVNLKDNYMHLQANFDEGQVSTRTQYYTNPTLYQAYKTLLSRSLNKQLLENAPVAYPAVLMASSIDPTGIKQFLKDIEWTEKIGNMVHAITLNLDQFVDMLSGDFLVLLKDVAHLEKNRLKTDSSHTEDKKMLSDLVLGVGIRNRAVYDTLKNNLLRTGILEKKENHYEFFHEIFVLEKDSMVYFTKNELVKGDFYKGLRLDNPKILKMTTENWFMLHAEQSVVDKSIKSKKLLGEVARSLLKNPNVKLETATIQLANIGNKSRGESLVLLQDKTANSLLAMLEVLKEIVYQTKLRLDPNYYQGNSRDSGKD